MQKSSGSKYLYSLLKENDTGIGSDTSTGSKLSPLGKHNHDNFIFFILTQKFIQV